MSVTDSPGLVEIVQRRAGGAKRRLSGAVHTGLRLRRAIAARRSLAVEAATRLTDTSPSAVVLRRLLDEGSRPRPEMISSLLRPGVAAALSALEAGDLEQADWLAGRLVDMAPGDGRADEVQALVALERRRPVLARELFARSRGIPADGPRARRWLRAQHQRLAVRGVMLRRAGLDAVPSDDPVLLWAQAERQHGDTRAATRAAAVAAAARPGSSEDVALWCRRYLLACEADGSAVPTVVRSDIDAELDVVRRPDPAAGDLRFTTVLGDGHGLSPRRHGGADVTVALYLPHERHERDVAAVVRALRARAGAADVELVLVHGALDPATVTEAVAADPALRFLRATHGALGLTRPDAGPRPRGVGLTALGLTGRRRLVVAPVRASALGAVRALALGGGTPPSSGLRDDVLGDTDLLVVDGDLADHLAGHPADHPADHPATDTGDGTSGEVLADLLTSGREHDRTAFDALPRLRDRGVLEQRIAPEVGFRAYGVRAFVPPADEPDGPADEALWQASEAAMDAVDNAGAAALLAAGVARPQQASERVVQRWSRALHRASEYERALEVLALVGDRDAADLAGAETAWVLHDRARGRGFVEAIARRDPEHPRLKGLRARVEAAEPSLAPGTTNLVHVAAYIGTGGNYGDRVLPTAVRDAVSAAAGRPLRYTAVHAHQLFDEPRRALADRSAGVIVGGGGLFLPDTAPNGNSGWQWNVPASQLRALDVPLGLVAVGFNVFRGQAFEGSLFEQNLAAVVDRADLIGLRNHGSIRQVRSLLPTRLGDKIEYLPCPTTVQAVLHPELATPVTRRRSVLVNAAYDRSARRFGNTYGAFLAQLDEYVRALRAADVDVKAVSHMAPDEQLGADLEREHGLELEMLRLNLVPLDEARTVYREAGVVVGMRGHATMIPFGLRTPVLSLVSHPKMRYFLDDIAHPEWGFEVTERFGDALLERTLDVLARPDSYVAEVVAAQEMLAEAVRAPLVRFAQLIA